MEIAPEIAELTPFETAFLAEYRSNGYNATRAYLAARPDVQYTTATVNSCKLLQEPRMVRAIQAIQSDALKTSAVNKQGILLRAGTVVDKAEDAEQYSAALKGLELQAKLIGAFEDDADSEAKYSKFLTIVQNNVVINTTNNSKAKQQVDYREIRGECAALTSVAEMTHQGHDPADSPRIPDTIVADEHT
jgi:hypothetical protein